MSNKLKELNRAFSKKILATAEKVAEKYEVILAFKDGRWYGKGIEMPTVFGEGKNPNECIADTREALVSAVAYLLEIGENAPTPATEGKRTEQVNVRLTAEEKIILSASAKSHGFRGLADYLRARALATGN